MKIQIKHRITQKVVLEGNYGSIKECLVRNRGVDLRGADLRGVDLRGAYLGSADLRGVDLRGAYLGGVDLRGADLRGVKNYYNSHEIIKEIIRRQNTEIFTEKEWAIIGKIDVHRFCWDKLKKNFGKKLIPILKKIKELGWGEYLEYFQAHDKE